jgi:ParB family chromosome partitioning protein
MNIEFLKTAPPFRDLFPINDKVLERVYWDMQKNGYDRSQPIVIWEGHDTTVIDGHTRLRAARKAKIFDVPVMPKAFSDENEALQYAIRCQRNRRNLKDFEIIKCMEELDKRRDKMANLKQNHTEAPNGASIKSATKTADLLGISTRKVERTRAVLDHAPEEIKEAVKSGKMSIHAACQTVNQNKEKTKIVPLTKEEQAALAEVLKYAENRLSERLFDEFSLVLTKILTRHGNEV